MDICIGKRIAAKDDPAALPKGLFGSVPDLPQIEIGQSFEVCRWDNDGNGKRFTLTTQAVFWLPFQVADTLLLRSDSGGSACRAVEPIQATMELEKSQTLSLSRPLPISVEVHEIDAVVQIKIVIWPRWDQGVIDQDVIVQAYE